MAVAAKEMVMKTDIELQRDVLAALQEKAHVDLIEIGIYAGDGIVTLRGRVSSQAEKWSVVHAAECVEGVRAIVNRIQVQLCSDEELACSVLAALGHQGIVNSPVGRYSSVALKVHVEQGWIILRGVMDSGPERTRVENVVRNVAGVRGVSNRIETKMRLRSSAGPRAINPRPARQFKIGSDAGAAE
jgi:osmotically-inducible protein OsmY